MRIDSDYVPSVAAVERVSAGYDFYDAWRIQRTSRTRRIRMNGRGGAEDQREAEYP